MGTAFPENPTSVDDILRISFGSDERTHLTDFIEQELRSRGHQVDLVGPAKGQPLQWADVAQAVAEPARGARAWNDANILCLSLRTTTEDVAGEILEASFSASSDASEAENVDKLNDLDRRYRPRKMPVTVEEEKGRN